MLDSAGHFFASLAIGTNLAVGDSTPINPETFLVDVAKYLPPIVGCMGAFIPLLMYAAIVDHFAEFGKLIFAMLGIEIWLAYLATAKYGAYLGYPDELTLAMLTCALGSLTALVWHAKRSVGKRHYLKWIFVFYSMTLISLSVAASNFFGFASLHIYVIRNSKNYQAANAIKKQILDDAKDQNGKIPEVDRKRAEQEYERMLRPKSIDSVKVVRDDQKPELYVRPLQPLWSNDYCIILTGDLYTHFTSFKVHVHDEKNPTVITKDEFREDISRWAYGDVYEAPLRK